MMDPKFAMELLGRYRNGSCSTAEKELVEQWYNQLMETGDCQLGDDEKAVLMQAMESRLLDRINAGTITERPVYSISFLQRTRWLAAAAIFIVLAGIGTYFIFFNKQTQADTIAKAPAQHDVKAPQANKAVVILANGRQVYLDSIKNGQLAQQGTVKLVKLPGGEIAYQAAGGEIIKKIEYNTLVIPKGSQVATMTLSDGSKVWLNAGSSITYPILFTGNERKVVIDGEAYFEVAHNDGMPFKVVKGGMQVQVLGTHFNINAYQNEADIKVTLLEGSVRLVNGNGKAVIKPGQQAQLKEIDHNNAAGIRVVNDVNIDKVMAWKNGLFDFEDATLQEVMRQLERWYDIEVLYEKNVPAIEFLGKMGKDLTLREVLRGLELSKVHWKIEGRKVTIMP
jgi:ferric-dicitrate binding protein FerR (iron transport regulator)